MTIKTNKIGKQTDTLSTHQHNGTKLFSAEAKNFVLFDRRSGGHGETSRASTGQDDAEREEDCSMWMCLGWNARYAMSDSQLRFDQPAPRCIGTGLKDLCGFYWLESVMDGNPSVQRLVLSCVETRLHERLRGQYPDRLCIRYENMRLCVGVSCCHDPM